MEYEIREIQPGEAAKLKHLACPNFSVVEQLFMTKPKFGVVAQTPEGSIAGAAFLVMVESREKRIGCVDIMFVLPKYRGSGVAKLLYHAAVEVLHHKGCETVMALVRGDNSQSLRRFEDEGLYPTSLHQLQKRIGFSATAKLFIKTAALAWATGCWILCEGAEKENRNKIGKSLLHVVSINGILLLTGTMLGMLLHTSNALVWNLVAAFFFLGIITLGETLGRYAAGGNWYFFMAEAGLVPSAIAALLGGFYPMLGHWYVAERENTEEYRKRMAKPAKAAWLLLILVTILCAFLKTMHPFFISAADVGAMLLVLYLLPFYPFDTFGGRRVRESSKYWYAGFAIVTIIVLVLMECGIL